MRTYDPASGLPRHSLVALGCLLLLPASALCQSTPYCQKVRARAAGDSALLFSPSLLLQGIRFPASGGTDLGATNGIGYQLRASLSLSPLDVYKGFLVLSAGELDCRQHVALEEAQGLLTQAEDIGRLPALRRRAAFLDEKKAVWERVAAGSDERLARHITPLLEVQEIRVRCAELERRRIQAGSDVARLEAQGFATPSASASSLAAAVDRTAMRYEHEMSHLRTLDGWSVNLTGGIIPVGSVGPVGPMAPPASAVDYFGIIQVGFNFGGIARYIEEPRYLAARAAELSSARYEVAAEARRFEARVSSAHAQARSELFVVTGQLSSLTAIREALERADVAQASHALAIVTLDAISVESDQVYLSVLAGELSRQQPQEPQEHGKE